MLNYPPVPKFIETPDLERPELTREVILEAELEQAKREIIDQKEKNDCIQKHYTVSTLSEDVLKMETGLPTREVFHIVVNCLQVCHAHCMHT